MGWGWTVFVWTCWTVLVGMQVYALAGAMVGRCWRCKRLTPKPGPTVIPLCRSCQALAALRRQEVIR